MGEETVGDWLPPSSATAPVAASGEEMVGDRLPTGFGLAVADGLQACLWLGQCKRWHCALQYETDRQPPHRFHVVARVITWQ